MLVPGGRRTRLVVDDISMVDHPMCAAGTNTLNGEGTKPCPDHSVGTVHWASGGPRHPYCARHAKILQEVPSSFDAAGKPANPAIFTPHESIEIKTNAVKRWAASVEGRPHSLVPSEGVLVGHLAILPLRAMPDAKVGDAFSVEFTAEAVDYESRPADAVDPAWPPAWRLPANPLTWRNEYDQAPAPLSTSQDCEPPPFSPSDPRLFPALPMTFRPSYRKHAPVGFTEDSRQAGIVCDVAKELGLKVSPDEVVATLDALQGQRMTNYNITREVKVTAMLSHARMMGTAYTRAQATADLAQLDARMADPIAVGRTIAELERATPGVRIKMMVAGEVSPADVVKLERGERAITIEAEAVFDSPELLEAVRKGEEARKAFVGDLMINQLENLAHEGEFATHRALPRELAILASAEWSRRVRERLAERAAAARLRCQSDADEDVDNFPDANGGSRW
jgi:hypothetical protein